MCRATDVRPKYVNMTAGVWLWKVTASCTAPLMTIAVLTGTQATASVFLRLRLGSSAVAAACVEPQYQKSWIIRISDGNFFLRCVVVAGLGRMACLSSYNTAFMYAPEVYPTALRSTGLGAASSIARISGMAAPFIVQLRHDELEVLGHTVTGLYLPCGVFCAMAVVAMGIALLAPESKGKSLDDDGTESVGGLELLAEVMGRGQRLPFRRYTSEPLVRRDPWQGQGFPRSNTGF